jgi:hypothetical protein
VTNPYALRRHSFTDYARFEPENFSKDGCLVHFFYLLLFIHIVWRRAREPILQSQAIHIKLFRSSFNSDIIRTQNTHKHPCLRGIRTHDPSVGAGEDSSCLRPRGHCDRRLFSVWLLRSAAPSSIRLCGQVRPLCSGELTQIWMVLVRAQPCKKRGWPTAVQQLDYIPNGLFIDTVSEASNQSDWTIVFMNKI